jgi:hypothetical protein
MTFQKRGYPMLFFNAYVQTWPMCLAMFLFFVAISLLVLFHRVARAQREWAPRRVFWANLALWFVMMSAVMTLIDKPRLDYSPETLDWFFMVSAFLGIPLSMPFLAGVVWAAACSTMGKKVRLSDLALISLAAFGLGCAVSNVHDVAWCSAITKGYTQHHMAGYDLDVFVGFARWFGIPREVSADYATLGPCALVLIAGELMVSVACFVRLKRGAKPE